jgi:preprotein translocase subunit SecE
MQSVTKFVREVRQETAKVTWPTAKETRTSTIMVLVLVMFAALFFWLVDGLIAAGIHFILGLGA